MDGHSAGLVVQGHIAAGDGNAQILAGLGQSFDGLRELPHDRRILGRTEVQAVGDRTRNGAGGRDIAVGLGQRELRSAGRVEERVATVGIGGDGHAQSGLLVDADDSGIVGERLCGVALNVLVVLGGDPRLRRQVRGTGELQHRRTKFVIGGRLCQARGFDGVRGHLGGP